MIDRGVAPATINRRLSALRSLVSLGKDFGYVFDLTTKNVPSQAYRDTRGQAARDTALFLLACCLTLTTSNVRLYPEWHQ